MLLSPRQCTSPRKGTAAFMNSGRTRDPSLLPTAGAHVVPYGYDDKVLRLATPQAVSFDKSAYRVPPEIAQKIDQGGYRSSSQLESRQNKQAVFQKHVKSVRLALQLLSWLSLVIACCACLNCRAIYTTTQRNLPNETKRRHTGSESGTVCWSKFNV